MHIQDINEKKDLYAYFFGEEREYELVQRLCEKNGNWKNYPLTDNFFSKYNEKDGILGRIEFNKVDVYPYRNVANGDFLSRVPHIKIRLNNELMIYFYQLKYKNEVKKNRSISLLDDIELSEPISVVVDSSGKFDFKMPFYSKYYKLNNLNILTGNTDDVYIDVIAVTEKFHSKYPIFLDLFIHYSPLSFNHMRLLSEESDLDNNIAIIKVDSILECKERKYKVKLILDEKLYLDDCEVELLEEKEYTGRRENSDNATAKALYLHSNLEDINLTDEFKVRLKKEGSYFDDK